jgi:U3 small nucleolar RNA-associated protein 11
VSDAQSTTHEQQESGRQYRRRLLKELAARLARDKQLRYAERELEMQRLLMGKGRRRKLSGVELVHENRDEDEDEVDARKGRAAKPSRKAVDEKTWKPRVYKWKTERAR